MKIIKGLIIIFFVFILLLNGCYKSPDNLPTKEGSNQNIDSALTESKPLIDLLPTKPPSSTPLHTETTKNFNVLLDKTNWTLQLELIGAPYNNYEFKSNILNDNFVIYTNSQSKTTKLFDLKTGDQYSIANNDLSNESIIGYDNNFIYAVEQKMEKNELETILHQVDYKSDNTTTIRLESSSELIDACLFNQGIYCLFSNNVIVKYSLKGIKTFSINTTQNNIYEYTFEIMDDQLFISFSNEKFLITNNTIAKHNAKSINDNLFYINDSKLHNNNGNISINFPKDEDIFNYFIIHQINKQALIGCNGHNNASLLLYKDNNFKKLNIDFITQTSGFFINNELLLYSTGKRLMVYNLESNISELVIPLNISFMKIIPINNSTYNVVIISNNNLYVGKLDSY